MKKFIDYVNKYVAPFAAKLSKNIWVASLQDSVIVTLPLALVASVISIISIINKMSWIPGFPDLSPISGFSFGLIGIALAFVLPANILQRKNMSSKRYLAGIANVGMYLMLLLPQTADGMMAFKTANLGTGGMFLAIVSGYFTAAIFVALSKATFFKNSELIPEYIVSAFDSFLPIFLSLSLTYIVIYVFKVDFFALLTQNLTPLTSLGQSYWGLLVNVLVTGIMYSFGISPWLLYGLFFPILLDGVTQNVALVAQGLPAINIHIAEINTAFIKIGGVGTTLPLAFMLLKSRSQRLQAVGKAAIIPSCFNINEPLVFGAPIMLNPLLMIPFWLNSFIIPTIVYFAFKWGLVTIPSTVFNMFFVPVPFNGLISTRDWRSVILVVIVFAIATAVWYPFWKAYDNQLVNSEGAQKSPNV